MCQKNCDLHKNNSIKAQINVSNVNLRILYINNIKALPKKVILKTVKKY